MKEILLSVFLVVILIGFLIIIRGIWETKNFIITNYKLKTDKRDFESLKLVVLSDLHAKTYGKKNSKLYQAICDINPDVILIAGDMIIGRENVDFIPTAEFINKLSNKYKVVYGLGNHEEKLKRFEGLYEGYIKQLNNVNDKDDSIYQNGLFILDNESVLYSKNVVISGLSLEKKYFGRKKDVLNVSDIEEKLTPFDKDKYNIMIAHNPDHFKTYALSGADLIVSGHNHGGTVRMPIIGGIISTSFKFFPKYDKGVFEAPNGTTMVVSGGLGAHTINFRFFNRPELLVINIESK